MTSAERFKKLMSFDRDIDRTPMVEWAGWWDKTYINWYDQGLPPDTELMNGLNEYFDQDRLMQYWVSPRSGGCPLPPSHGAGIMHNEADYAAVKPYLYNQEIIDSVYNAIKSFDIANKDKGYAYWFSLEGFFWFPRELFGIHDHLMAFYDYPDLMLEINSDLLEFNKKVVEMICSVIPPAFMTFAEDMSYNHGPMISKDLYDEFMLPFYKQIIPLIKENGVKAMIDTDGFVEPLIPMFLEAGIEGILPLERMAGVDVNRIRESYPGLIMLGGFDKTIMHKGEGAMRAEFERILPAIKSGGYIPAVDHQTPPDVSMENYKIFMKLLNEYSRYIFK